MLTRKKRQGMEKKVQKDCHSITYRIPKGMPVVVTIVPAVETAGYPNPMYSICPLIPSDSSNGIV